MHLINWLLPTQQKQKETIIIFCFLLLQQIWPFASYSKSSGGYSLPHTETFYPGGKYMQNTQTHALILNVKACVKIKPLVKWLSLSSCERSKKKTKQKKQNKTKETLLSNASLLLLQRINDTVETRVGNLKNLKTQRETAETRRPSDWWIQLKIIRPNK